MTAFSKYGCCNCGADTQSGNPLCRDCAYLLDDMSTDAKREAGWTKCPFGDVECIPSEKQWACPDCEAERRPRSSKTGSDTIFVYGTLLAGLTHGPMLGSVREPARIRGRLHFIDSTKGFPVLIPDETQWVLGELVTGDLFAETWRDVISMEVGVGYDLRHTLAYPLAFIEEKVQALVFAWPWPNYGEPVPNNDWSRRYNPRKVMPWAEDDDPMTGPSGVRVSGAGR